MKQFFVFLLLLLSTAALAQNETIGKKNGAVVVQNDLKVSGDTYIGFKDTTGALPAQFGVIRYRPLDATPYIYLSATGQKWYPMVQKDKTVQQIPVMSGLFYENGYLKGHIASTVDTGMVTPAFLATLNATVNKRVTDIQFSGTGTNKTFTLIFNDGTQLVRTYTDEIGSGSGSSVDVAKTFVNVSDPLYNAPGDGTTDATTPLNNAFSSGAKQVYLERGARYLVTASLIVPSDVQVIGNGATIIPGGSFPTTSNYPLIKSVVTPLHSASSQSIAVVKGRNWFLYSSASTKLTQGKVVRLTNGSTIPGTVQSGNTYTYAWIGVVQHLGGDTCYLSTAASFSFNATSINSQDGGSNWGIRDVTFDTRSRPLCFVVNPQYAQNVTIENCTFLSDGGINGVRGNYNTNVHVLRSTFDGFTYDNGASFGTGVQLSGVNLEVGYCTFSNTSQPTAFGDDGTRTVGIYMHHNTVTPSLSGTTGLDVHGNCEQIDISYNKIAIHYPIQSAIQIRSGNAAVHDNEIWADNTGGGDYTMKVINAGDHAANNIDIYNNRIMAKGVVTGIMFGAKGMNGMNNKARNNYLEDANIAVAEPLGAGFEASGNTIVMNAMAKAIDIYAKIAPGYKIINNNFLNNLTNTSTQYAVRVQPDPGDLTQSADDGVIAGNTVTLTNSSNVQTQFRYNTRHMQVYDNTVYAAAATYTSILSDTQTNKENWRNNNRAVNAAGTWTINNVTAVPTTDFAWFEGRSLWVSDATTGVSELWICKKTSSTSYAWQKVTTAP